MKNTVIYIFLSVVLLIFIPGALSQSTGNTIINTTVSGNLSMWLEYPEIVVPEDYYFYGNLTLTQSGGNQTISVYLNKTDANSFMKFVRYDNGSTYYEDDHTTQLLPGTPKNVTFRIFVPDGMGYDGGTYNIDIFAYSLNDSRTDTDLLKVHVNSTNPIDDIEIISINPSSLYSGQNLDVDISIHKIFPTEMTDIQICYCIDENPAYLCGPSYNDYGCAWKAIKDWLNYTKSVTVNENPGEFYFIIAVSYPNDQNIKRANSPKFYVLSTSPPSPPSPGGVGPPSHIEAPQAQLVIDAPDYLESAPGERLDFSVLVTNTGDVNAPNTALNLYGVPENWIYVSPPEQDIGAGQSKNYTVSVLLPRSAHEQAYYLSLVAKSGTVEATKDITMVVGMTAEKRAKFFLEEAQSKKEDADIIIGKCQDFGMNTLVPERIADETDPILRTAERMYEIGYYEESIDNSKEAIDGYNDAIKSAEDILDGEYLILLDAITKDIENPEYAGEGVMDNVKSKVDQSIVFHNQGRVLDAYETILDAKQLLDEMKAKRTFAYLINIIIIIAVILILGTFFSMFFLYKKQTMRFVKRFRVEEHKKSLRYLFKRKTKPSYVYKEKPKEKPKEEKRAYGTLSEEEKKLVSKEDITAKLYKKKSEEKR
jgi:hypothetical protein